MIYPTYNHIPDALRLWKDLFRLVCILTGIFKEVFWKKCWTSTNILNSEFSLSPKKNILKILSQNTDYRKLAPKCQYIKVRFFKNHSSKTIGTNYAYNINLNIIRAFLMQERILTQVCCLKWTLEKAFHGKNLKQLF